LDEQPTATAMARARAANLPNFSISIVKLLMNPSVLSIKRAAPRQFR
jgi:hypothetical protein